MKVQIAALVFCTLVAGAARADHLSAIGGICVPDSATVASGALETGGFGVRFKAGHIGTIRLLCPVAQSCLDLGGFCAPIPDILVSAIDPDGTGVATNIVVSLHEVNRGSNLSSTAGTCSTGSNPATGPSVTRCPMTPQFVPRGAFQWWEVTLTRTTTSLNPEFLGVDTDFNLNP